MDKFSFGLFGLFILGGHYLGSTFGAAIAICIFIILDGLHDEFKRRKKALKIRKDQEEGK